MGEEPLHWSERAKLTSQSSFPPISELRQPPPHRSKKKLVVAGAGIVFVAVVAVAVVVLMTSSESTASTPTVSSTIPPSTTPSSTPSTTVTTSQTQQASPTTTIADSDGLVSYTDTERRLSIKYPASWENTDLARLGDGKTDPYGVVGFADQNGPEQDGQFLNFAEVAIFEDVPVYESMLPAVEEGMRLNLEGARNTYEDVKVLEPIHSVLIGEAPGFAMTLSFFWRGHTMIVSDYVLIADQRICELELSAVEEDFEEYTPLFQRIVQDFQVGPSPLRI